MKTRAEYIPYHTIRIQIHIQIHTHTLCMVSWRGWWGRAAAYRRRPFPRQFHDTVITYHTHIHIYTYTHTYTYIHIQSTQTSVSQSVSQSDLEFFFLCKRIEHLLYKRPVSWLSSRNVAAPHTSRLVQTPSDRQSGICAPQPLRRGRGRATRPDQMDQIGRDAGSGASRARRRQKRSRVAWDRPACRLSALYAIWLHDDSDK